MTLRHLPLARFLLAGVFVLFPLTADAGLAPSNDACATPAAVGALPFNVVLDTTAATTAVDDPLQGCSFGGAKKNSKSVWYSFTPAASGVLAVDTFGSNYDTVLTAFTGSCGALTEVACSDDDGLDAQSRIVFNVTAGTPYLFEVTSFGNSGGGSLHLNIKAPTPPANDLCSAPTVINTTPFSVTGVDTTGATGAGDDPMQVCAFSPPSNSVWYGFTAPGNGTVSANTFDSDYDTVLSAHTGPCGALALVECNDDVSDENLTSQIDFPVTGGVAYLLLITSLDNDSGLGGSLNFALTFQADATPTPSRTATPTRTRTPTPIATPTITPAGKPGEKCQKALKKSGGTFVKKKLKILEGCRKDLFKCIETRTVGPEQNACATKAGAKCAAALTEKLVAAGAKFTASVSGKCAGLDVSMLRSATLGLGFEGIEAQCPAALTGLPEVAACVLAQHECSAEAMFEMQAPRIKELLVRGGVSQPLIDALECLLLPNEGMGLGVPDEATGKALVKCTGAIAKAGAKFASKKQRNLEKCVDRLFVCTQSKLADPGCEGKAAEACAKEFAKIVAEEGKFAAAITKACPATLYSALRDDLGANLDVLTARCASYGVADITADVGQYALCLVRSHECEVEELIQTEAPRAVALIGGAGIVPPVVFPREFCPTPNPTPTM